MARPGVGGYYPPKEVPFLSQAQPMDIKQNVCMQSMDAFFQMDCYEQNVAKQIIFVIDGNTHRMRCRTTC